MTWGKEFQGQGLIHSKAWELEAGTQVNKFFMMPKT